MIKLRKNSPKKIVSVVCLRTILLIKKIIRLKKDLLV